MTIFIENGHPHRQTARREEVLHANRLFHAQQRLQTVGKINRRQRIEIAHSRTRPLANPEQVITVFILRRIAILNNTLMQRFQGLVTFDGHLTQTKVRHTEIIAADQEYAIQIIGSRKIVAPVAHKPRQRLQRTSPGVAHHRTVGVGKQRLKIRYDGFVIPRPQRHHAVFRR